jgi:hypothetical protein
MQTTPALASPITEDTVVEHVPVHEDYYLSSDAPTRKKRKSPVKKVSIAKLNLFIAPATTPDNQATWVRVCVSDLLSPHFQEGSMMLGIKLQQCVKWEELDKQVRAKLSKGVLSFVGREDVESLDMVDDATLATALMIMKEIKEEDVNQVFKLVHTPME